MGGTNQAECPTPTIAVLNSTLEASPIRYHEVSSRGEVDFHDDKAKFKCAIDNGSFFTAYNKWRSELSENLVLLGNDGKGGHSVATFIPYTDNNGNIQVSIVVTRSQIGNTIKDLDKLAHFS